MKCPLKTRLWGHMEMVVESYEGHEDKDWSVTTIASNSIREVRKKKVTLPTKNKAVTKYDRGILLQSLEQESANIFYKRPGSKFFKGHNICHSYPTLVVK